MLAGFTPIKPEQITENTFKLIGSDWMLITAGSPEKFNTMTASWGGFGILWNKKVCFCVIRPHRYTYEFVEGNDRFTLSFFDEKFREALNLCGTKSGRDVDKAAAAGLTPVSVDEGTVSFSEARLVLECRKMYFHDFDPANFIDQSIARNYPDRDYHRMYVGEVTGCYVKNG